MESFEKPGDPGGDVHPTFLCLFQDVVVGTSVLADAGGHGVEALPRAICPSEREVSNGSGDAAVPIPDAQSWIAFANKPAGSTITLRLLQRSERQMLSKPLLSQEAKRQYDV